MFKHSLRIFFTLGFLIMSTQSLATPTPSVSNQEALIPRTVLFADPNYANVQISPDGKYLSYLAPHQGVLNVWVGKANQKDSMHPITDNKTRGIAGHFWAYNNEYILYYEDNSGDENWKISRVDIKTGKKSIVADLKKVQTRIIAASPNFPDDILIGLNQRRADLHDIYRLNTRTGKLDLVYENNDFASFIADRNLNVKLAMQAMPDGNAVLYTLDKNFAKTLLMNIDKDDIPTTYPISLNKTGDVLYLMDGRGRNTATLSELNLASNALKVIAENEKSDINDVMIHPTEKTIQGYSFNYEKEEWTIIDPKAEKDWNTLKTLAEGELSIVDRSLDDNTWIVAFLRDNGPAHYYSFDRNKGQSAFMFSSKPKLEGLPLTKMTPVIIQSRDNLPMVSYLSLPKSIATKTDIKPENPLPMILLVHGGPHARDEWGYNGLHQWLSNRGFAVLSVNYRGSSGFGKNFANAGNGEWAGKMHDDLIDAVKWAIAQGITSKDKVVIMGGSYGGYATLVGLTKTPEVFACGIDIVGVSNLETFLNSIPPYWKPFYATLKKMVGGDPETDAGRKFLASRSPLTFADKITKPLLIGQGANDPRVKEAESNQIVKMMESKGIPVTYVLYPDEGHGFARPENRMSFFAVTEAFLAQHMGTKFEPVNHDFKNSSLEIVAGKKEIKGL